MEWEVWNVYIRNFQTKTGHEQSGTKKVPVSDLLCCLMLELGSKGMQLKHLGGILQPGLSHQSTEPFRQVYILLPVFSQPADQKYNLKAPEADKDPFGIILPLAPIKNCFLFTSGHTGERLSVAAWRVTIQPCLVQCLSSPSVSVSIHRCTRLYWSSVLDVAA